MESITPKQNNSVNYFQWTGTIYLHIEFEEHYVSVLDHVLLTLKSHLSVLFHLGFATVGDKILVVIYFSLDKAFLKICVYDTCTLRSLASFLEGPSPVFVLSCREESPEAKGMIGSSYKMVEAAFLQTHCIQEFPLLFLTIQGGDFAFYLSTNDDNRGIIVFLGDFPYLLDVFVVLPYAVFVYVADVDHRFHGDEVEII